MARLEDVIEVLKQVRYPGLKQDIVGLGYVKEVGLEDGRLQVRLEIQTTETEAVKQIELDTRAALEAAGHEFDLTIETPRPADAPEGGPKEASQVEFVDLLPEVPFKIAVASGKGGVGKSTVAVNLALALERLGAKVGLLDADIYGPSMPTMLGIRQQKPTMDGDKLSPVEAQGIKVVSLGFLTEGITPIIWRGPLAGRAIEQLLTDVDWSGVEFLVMDLPPGTGDVQISLSQKANLTGAVIVTTPQDVAMIDAIKGVQMFKKVNVPVLGIIENMSFFECPHCQERSEIYPRGVLGKEMERIGASVMGRIPIDPRIAVGGDQGRPIIIEQPDSVAGQAFAKLAATVKGTLERRKEG